MAECLVEGLLLSEYTLLKKFLRGVKVTCLTGNPKVRGSNPSPFYILFAKKLVPKKSTWP